MRRDPWVRSPRSTRTVDGPAAIGICGFPEPRHRGPLFFLSCLSALVFQAAGAMGDTKTCPEHSPSFTYRSKIVNELPSPIMLNAGKYDCNDWSGVSTPGKAFTGKIIQPGETMSFTLEPRRNVNRAWTMEFLGASGSTSFGTARLPDTARDRREDHGAHRN